jgi:hypothetical protein
VESEAYEQNLQINIDVGAARSGVSGLSRIVLEVKLRGVAGMILTTGDGTSG